jgi:uncharacterized RDD family membrane protein YckC
MAEEWYVGSNGQQSGPFTLQQLRQMAASGQLSKTDLIWKEGLANWVPCSSAKGLFPAAADFSPTSSPRPAPRPTAPPPRGPVPSEGGLAGSDVTGGVDPLLTGQTTPNPATIGGAPFQLAEFLPRVGAALLDALFLGLIGCIPNVLVVVMLTMATTKANNPDDAQAAGILANVCMNIIGFVVAAIYYITLDASAKQGTWGKQIVGLRVTDLEGRRISVGRAIGRFFARYLTVCTCGIGFLLPLFTQKRQTLHDLICGCIVVNK